MLPPSCGGGSHPQTALRPWSLGNLRRLYATELSKKKERSTLNCTLNLKTPSFLFFFISLICHLSLRFLQPCVVFLSYMCVFEGQNRALKRKNSTKPPEFYFRKTWKLYMYIFVPVLQKKYCFFCYIAFLQNNVLCAHTSCPRSFRCVAEESVLFPEALYTPSPHWRRGLHGY